MQLNSTQMPRFGINGFEIDRPIIQGGMGVGISMSGLASAVANEGGIGVISSVGLGLLEAKSLQTYRDENKTILRREIHKARILSSGILGLNIMVAVTDYDELVKIAFDEEIDIVFLGAGLPLKFPKEISPGRLKHARTRVGVIVSSARATQIIFQSWKKNFDHVPDLVVVEGPMAGGHLGFKIEQIDDPDYRLEKLIPEVLSVVNRFEEQVERIIPVIAAGGIFTGADIYKFLSLGAQGVQMATRFVATHECDASLQFKQSYLNCKKDDLIIIKSPVGLPGRAIRNKFLDEVKAGERKPFKCPWQCLKTCDFREVPYCIAQALKNARQGMLEEGYTFAGSNAYRVNEIISVKELFHKLEQEYKEAVYHNSLKQTLSMAISI
jgi:NAD(P)H-dependent flavin oxidoreductase YrpB (nitropropane dioxygenase family)